jgi:hypothetical protein
MIVVGLALVLAGTGLVIWLISGDDPPSGGSPDDGSASTSTEAIDASLESRDSGAPDGLVFDAAGVGRTPRAPTRKITSKEVRRLQRRYAGQIRYCYQKPQQRAAPLIKRKTNVVVHLAPFGRVTRVDVYAGGDRELQACLRRFIKQWRFPSTLGQQKVRFPIVFAR